MSHTRSFELLFANATASVSAVFGTVWTKSLGLSRAKTNTLVTRNGIYAGNLESIHRLDPRNGNQLGENTLMDNGYHEVRLAATLDSEKEGGDLGERENFE